MQPLELSNLETADLCRELALLLHAGVGIGDGLYLLAEEEKDGKLHSLLENMAKTVDTGAFLSRAFEESGCFPAYIIGLLRVGETVGRVEGSDTGPVFCPGVPSIPGHRLGLHLPSGSDQVDKP